jgi:hypothetical protein
MTASSWSSTLDRIDADLTATERAIDQRGREQGGRDRSSIPALAAGPFPQEPMPEELGPRAQELLRRTRNLEHRAATEVEGVREALQAIAGHHRRPARRVTGRIVDVGA